MIRTYVVGSLLSEENREQILETAEKYGFDITFYETCEEAEGKTGDGEVIYCTNPGLLTQMPHLKWCHNANAGVDAFVVTGVFDSGEVMLTNSSGAYGLAISEYIIMVTLMLMRRVTEYQDIVSRGEWLHHLPVRSIAGSRIAIVGTGNLGSNAAKRFKALGASSVTGFSRSGRSTEGFDEVFTMDSFEERIAGTDVLVLCVPGTSESAGLLSAERIAVLPEKAFVINVGRGTLVDQDALIDALNAGRIAGAALDVMVPEPLPEGHPLRSAKNCIITPHVSGDYGLPHTVDKTVEFFCENMKRYAAGEPLVNLIDPARGY